MRIQHTFICTFVLGLAWCGYLFGVSVAPDPASNGVFGDALACATSGCHGGNPVNFTGGSITITGLPTAWLPDQTYPLTIAVQRSGQTKFGFQLSAVGDATNQQAGTLTAGASNVQVITAGGIQYAEHRNADSINTFSVNWTAPTTANVGTIRFNLAGNAANGDTVSTGDFTYTRVDRVFPATPTDKSELGFLLPDRGGLSVISDGSSGLSAGYSRIQPAPGSTTPIGVAIFGLRQNNVLVTEAGVPASPPIVSGRIYAEVNGPVNTGLAIANPNNQAAVIHFHFTNSAGDFGSGSTTIAANQQLARFLDQAPFNGGPSVQGTFSFSSSVPVSVIALRGFTNERGEFLITTLPVTDLSLPASVDITFLPHFADGGGWTTQIVLVNPTDSTLAGRIEFFGQGSPTFAAFPVTLIANGQSASSFPYSIPPQGSFKLVTAGVPPDTSAGSVHVVPTQGAAPSSLVIFSYKPGGTTVAEAGVPGIRGNAFRMYVEITGIAATAGAIQTGFAIANPASTRTVVNLELSSLDGVSVAPPFTLFVPGNGHVSNFVHELFPTVTFPFKGVLRISGGGTLGVSVVGLRARYNERSDFLITTTIPSDEASTPTSAEWLFPHFVNGGGYTTQFLLFTGSTNQTSDGKLRFFKQDGTPLGLTLN